MGEDDPNPAWTIPRFDEMREVAKDLIPQLQNLYTALYNVLNSLWIAGVTEERIMGWNMDNYQWLELFKGEHTEACNRHRQEVIRREMLNPLNVGIKGRG